MTDTPYRPSRFRVIMVAGLMLALVAAFIALVVSLVVFVGIPLLSELKLRPGGPPAPVANPAVAVAATESLRKDLPLPPPIYPPGGNRPTDIRLPATPAQAAIGGSGRYLVLHFPELGTAGVFDVCRAEFVHYLPAPEPDTRIAVGADFAVLYDPVREVFERWTLATGKLERTVESDGEHEIDQLVMGSASNGPIVSVSKTFPSLNAVRVANAETFEPVAPNIVLDLFGRMNQPGLISVSPDGQAITKCELAPAAGYQLSKISLPPDGVPSLASGRQISRNFTMSFDGKWGFGAGLFDSSLKRITRGPEDGLSYFAAAHDPYYFAIKPTTGQLAEVSVHSLDGFQPLLKLNNVEVGPIFQPLKSHQLPSSQRFYLVPRAERLIVLLPEKNRLMLLPVEIEKARRTRGLPAMPFEMRSLPPAVPGQLWHATIIGPFDLEVVRGPEGLKVDDSGDLNWRVPNSVPAGIAELLLRLTNAQGMERLVGMRITVTGDSPEELERLPVMPRSP